MNTTTATATANTTKQTTVKNNFATKLGKLLKAVKNFASVPEGAPYVKLPSNFKNF